MDLEIDGAVVMPNSLIVSDLQIMLGKPVVAGTRITVELILEKLGAGESHEQILEAHPQLTEDAIRAAMQFDDEQDHREQAAWAAASKEALECWCRENPF